MTRASSHLFGRGGGPSTDSGRAVSEEGKEWCDGPAKTSSGGDTSEELDAAMGASENDWWRWPGGDCGGHGDGDVFCGRVCALPREK